MRANHLQVLRTALCAAFVERSEAVDAALTATIAGEHTFILGPPGTAKSAMVRALSGAWGLRYWEVLMTRFSTPEDLFGPVKLSALQADSFERATSAYMPGAEVVFLDEVWKANGGILNALLTILNERTYHNGGVACPVPLVSCIGASNELPEGPELEALYDRFMIRLHVDYIVDRGSFLAMLTAPPPSIPVVPVDVRAEQRAADAVVVGSEVFEAIADTRSAAQKAGMAISDRRWRKSLSLIRATAHLDGRTTAHPDDLGILEHSLWREPSERSAVCRLVQGVVSPNGAQAVAIYDSARELVAAVPDSATLDALGKANAELSLMVARLASLGTGKKIVQAKGDVGALQAGIVARSRKAASAMGFSL